jgi:hypothetical protein
MADLYTLVNAAMADGTIARIARDPNAQFGAEARRYLGATLLPEQTVDENAFREDAVKYRTVIANDGTRYSPAQKKGSEIVGSFLVELAHQDIASEMTGRAYDALVKLLNSRPTMEAAAALVNFVDTTINRALLEKAELQRWQAIVDASVPLSGDNGYSETVSYSNPANHRAAAGGTWSSDAYDPFVDILAMADLLAGKGYTISRIITSRTVLSILANNDKVKARTGIPVVNVGGTLAINGQRASMAAISDALDRDGLPPIETYDLQYRTQTGTGYFLSRAAFVMVAETGRDALIDQGDSATVVMPNTLGYHAIGRAVGQATPGRVIRSEAFSNKPPRIEAEGWMTSLPVILEPEAIAVIHTIS